MNRLLIIFVVVVVFAAVMLALQGFYWYRVTAREKEAKELARRLGTGTTQEGEMLFQLNLKSSDEERGDLGTRLAEDLERLIMQAGDPFTIQALITQMVIASLVGGALFTILTRSAVGVLGLALGYIPVMLLKARGRRRNERITEQLPDALELLSRSLQAGHGISEAMRNAATELNMPIAGEFGRVYEQNNLGMDFRDSMGHLVARNPQNFDLKIFASSVLLQRETGGNLIEILESIANTIRQRFVFRGKVRALTAEAKFSAVILAGLPFFVGFAIYMMRPEYLSPFFEDPLGNLMGVGVIIWFVLGLFVMNEVTKVEV